MFRHSIPSRGHGRRFGPGVVLCLVAGLSGCDPTGDEVTPTPDPYIDAVVSVTFGEGAGFGQDKLPGVVLGPPVGVEDPSLGGSTDVVSLGVGGEIVVAFTDQGVIDGDGPDFVIFENPFWPSGNPDSPWAEPGIVSVSDDGSSWHAFPCDLEGYPSGYPYEGCAGQEAVFTNPDNGISPIDPAVSGGDLFDLAELGLQSARYVKIVDAGLGALASPASGFDLDAIAVIHGQTISD